MIMETSRKATREELAKRVDELQEKLDKQDKEIETYKKIAEKLAETLSVKLLETLGVKPNIKDLIESAKSEVLKDE